MRAPGATGSVVAALLLALATAGGIADTGAGPAKDIATLLPDDESRGQWKPEGEAANYPADDLYNLLDGGAQVYVEYGVVRAISREYSQGRDSVTCTIYEMNDPEAAFGMFSYARSADRTPFKVGDGGFEADLQLTFWQERYFVTIEPSSPGPVLRDAARAFAGWISQRIGDHAAPPAALERLRPYGVAPGSEKLVAGKVVADNLFFTGTTDLFKLASGDRLLYGERASGAVRTKVFLALYRQSDKAANVYADARKAFGAMGGYRPSGEEPSRAFFVKDSRYFGLRQGPDSMAVVAGAPSLQEARDILESGGR